MTRVREYQTEAIVIKKAKLGEADRILTLYTLYFGKIQAIAKGVSRPKSKLSGHLEILTHSLVSLVHGRNLDTIIGSQTIDSFFYLKNDLFLTSQALYLSELIDKFTDKQLENRPLFQLLLNTMQSLCIVKDRELLLRFFELKLLSNIGYQPQLQKCVNCDSILQPIPNIFCHSAGGILCPDCNRNQLSSTIISVNALKVLRLLQSGKVSLINQLNISPALSSELKLLIREYLEYHLDYKLKSINWLDDLPRQLNL